MDIKQFKMLMKQEDNPIICTLENNPRCSVEELHDHPHVEPCLAVAEGKYDYYYLTVNGHYSSYPKDRCEVHGVYEGKVVASYSGKSKV